MQLSLTDAASDAYKAIYVTIAEVQVNQHSSGDAEAAGWQTLLTPGGTYNLLELVNGTLASLGIADLAVGSYTQMRLVLDNNPDVGSNILGHAHPYGNYLIDNTDAEIELKVPSGMQTGIKLVHGFTIVRSGATELVMDFDAAKSVVKAGNSGHWLLKPTIKVLATVENSVTGAVTAASDDSPLPGTLVSAQLYDPFVVDASDVVTVEASTIADDPNGEYIMYLPADTYHIVAVKEDFLPACTEVNATVFQAHIVDLVMAAAITTGTLSGTLSGLAAAEDSATIGIRQVMDCGNGDVQVEVQSINVAEGGTYSLKLPVGSYKMIVSATGKTTLEADVEILDGVDTVQNAVF